MQIYSLCQKSQQYIQGNCVPEFPIWTSGFYRYEYIYTYRGQEGRNFKIFLKANYAVAKDTVPCRL